MQTGRSTAVHVFLGFKTTRGGSPHKLLPYGQDQYGRAKQKGQHSLNSCQLVEKGRQRCWPTQKSGDFQRYRKLRLPNLEGLQWPKVGSFGRTRERTNAPVLCCTLLKQESVNVQARRKVWKSGGAGSTVVGIICPPGWDRVNCLAKNWGGG